MKTETVKLPAYFASALINNDYSGIHPLDWVECKNWLDDFKFYGPALSCSDHIELAVFNGKLTDTLEFTFPVIYEKDGYLVYPVSVKTEYTWWQKQGLSFTASGYGKKIPTSQMILLCNKWRRVYCTIYSNIGTCWVIFNGKKLIVDSML